MAIWTRAWQNLKQHGDQYLAILLSAVAILIGYIGSSVEIILTCTAGVLTLLAWGTLRDRDNSDAIRREIALIKRNISSREKIGFSDVVVDLNYLIPKAKATLDIVAHSGEILKQYETQLVELGHRGCEIRLVIADSTDSVCQFVSVMHWSREDAAWVRMQFRNAARMLYRISKLLKAKNRGAFRIRLLPHISTLSMLIIDREQANAKAYAVITSFRRPGSRSPVVNVAKTDDERMFSYMTSQFDLYWDASRDILADDTETN